MHRFGLTVDPLWICLAYFSLVLSLTKSFGRSADKQAWLACWHFVLIQSSCLPVSPFDSIVLSFCLILNVSSSPSICPVSPSIRLIVRSSILSLHPSVCPSVRLSAYLSENPSLFACSYVCGFVYMQVTLGMICFHDSHCNPQVEPEDQCSSDYVVVTDSEASDDIFEKTLSRTRALELSQNTEAGTRLCGNVLPQSFTSSTNQLGVGFTSDYTLNSRGFKVAYTALSRLR